MKDLIIRIDGGVQETNFDDFKNAMLVKIEEANIPLIVDEDFAFAEKAIKVFKQAEDKIDLSKHNAMRDTADVAALFESLDELSTQLRTVRLDMNKKVKDEKAKRKLKIIDDVCKKLTKAIDISAETVPEIHHAIRVDRALFEKAVSGKRSIEKMQEAVDEILASEADRVIDLQVLILTNKSMIADCEFPSLFPDLARLVAKPSPEVQLIIEGRMAKHQLAEKERKEKEAEKAKTEQELETAPETVTESVGEQPEQHKIEPEKAEVPQTHGEAQANKEQEDKFILTIHITGQPTVAKGIAQEVNNLVGDYKAVTKIGLNQA